MFKTIKTVYVFFVEDHFSHEFVVDTIFKNKKSAERYLESISKNTGRDKSCYKIIEYIVYK